jgi:dihydroorotate dehydrogenase electron transfer subunit
MKKKAQRVACKVLRNDTVDNRFCVMQLEAATIARDAVPGQFVMVKPNRADDPLLRRPLGVHRVKGGTIRLLYEVIGKGTALLSRVKPGDSVDVIGPLGNGFPLLPKTEDRSAVLIAGGMGVAPLLFLAERLAGKKPLVLLGAKKRPGILCEGEFRALGCRVCVATDDGSRGFKGSVSALLSHTLSTADYGLRTLYACGPRAMLKAVARIAAAKRMPAYVSLEAHLSCGFGACLGCAVATVDGYMRVCKEGPVFEARQLIWEEE